jgi:hypothetical protein
MQSGHIQSILHMIDSIISFDETRGKYTDKQNNIPQKL